MTPETVAKACHEVNRAYCTALGDHSQPPWEEAPVWQRESALKGVLFHISNPTAPASSSHEQWMAEKIAAGWTYAPVKDPAKKEHPCMVPFDKLPVEQQAKDYLFKSVVESLRDQLDQRCHVCGNLPDVIVPAAPVTP